MPNSQIKSLTVGGVTYDIVDETSGYITGMTILSYGHSTWSDFTAAYNANQVVYCRASSNSDPGSGSQTRLAFMAYVDNATTPTNVEFQYYRSMSSHSITQLGDQVFVYKLTNAGTWSVTTRNASEKEIVVSGSLTRSWSNDVLTLTGTDTNYIPTGGTTGQVLAKKTDTNYDLEWTSAGGGSGTVTSVAVSNDTNGGLIVSGSPITSSGTITIGHSNVLTNAQTTSAVYPIKIDKNGHISEYGSAVSIPTSAASGTTGISIADHSTSTIYGVTSSTTSVTGVQSSTTTASKVTLGTAISVPNVTSAGSGSFTQGAFSGGSFTSGTFSGGSLTMTINNTDSKQLDIVFTAATHGADSFTAATHGSDSHTHTAPTLGTAISVPNVTAATDVTVPIKDSSATTVPIKDSSSTTVVTSKTHSVTDTGHTHSLS